MEMNFLHIEMLSDLLPYISDKREIQIMKQKNETQIVSYIVSTGETFNNIGSIECRGIVFDSLGKIICRPLHKFFNINERIETQMGVLPWNNIHRVMEKRDGSMINTCVINNNVYVKTKKSFTSDVAVIAQQWYGQHKNYINFAQEISSLNCTPTFEFTSPNNRIVLPYVKDEMTLLHIRHNFTGEYWNQSQLEEISNHFNIKLVESILVEDIFQFLKEYKDVKGVEGWVIQFNNGNMIKLKTEEYLKSHRLITFIRERDIAEMILDEKLDDVKSEMIERNISLSKLEAVEHRVLEIIRELEFEVEKVYNEDKNLSRKEFAAKHKGDKCFHLMIKRYSNQEPNYVQFFKDHILKNEFSLKQII